MHPNFRASLSLQFTKCGYKHRVFDLSIDTQFSIASNPQFYSDSLENVRTVSNHRATK